MIVKANNYNKKEEEEETEEKEAAAAAVRQHPFYQFLGDFVCVWFLWDDFI